MQGDQEGGLHGGDGDAGGDGIWRRADPMGILNQAPVVRDFLIIQMSDARYVGGGPRSSPRLSPLLAS